MIRKAATKKCIAVFFLSLMTLESLIPTSAWALTSGPVQPETKQFASAGTSEMVDLSTGNFKYNIPLGDVDGFPLNLNYASGVSMDDEASWVGLGWNLNVGAINRQLRGIADDASGDEVETENYMKPKITVGGRVTGRVELAGWSSDFGDIGLNGSLSVSVFSDNYLGYGADIGVGTGASLGVSLGGAQTTGLSLGSGISMNSSTEDGVMLSPTISLGIKKQMDDVTSVSAGLSANLGYNTREGLKSTTLGASFGIKSGMDDDDEDGKNEITARGSAGGGTSYSNTSYNTPPFYPRSGIAFKTRSHSYGFDIGGSVYFGYLGGGMTGYKTVRQILQPVTRHKAYGYMYAQRGKRDRAALMDFMREKDNPVVPNLPNLAIPISTPDLFSYTGHAGSGQFRLYRGNLGTLADPVAEDQTEVGAFNVEYGFGTYFHGGMTYNQQMVLNRSGKWIDKNDLLAKADYPVMTGRLEEDTYFRMVGEKSLKSHDPAGTLDNEDAVRVALKDKLLTDNIVEGNWPINQPQFVNPYKKQGRQPRRSPILALTAEDAAKGGLNEEIESYPFITTADFPQDACNIQMHPVKIKRTEENSYRKKHHISEITIVQDDGKQLVYGIPVYNIKQEEYTFAVDPAAMSTQDKERNLVPYTLAGGKIKHDITGTDHYYRRETQPAYATAHLLTGILSPDYVDLTNDGISDDDPGTAVKFNYSKADQAYKWRSPVTEAITNGGKAQYNKGLQADPFDDKGNIVYGEKELWYLHSIETKTKIAYFVTAERDDAKGVLGVHGGIAGSSGQRKLTEIRIYSKTDLNGAPIQTIHFSYGDNNTYLCPGALNSSLTNNGKLTLTKVWITYNSTLTDEMYAFGYDDLNPSYDYLSTDRWGNYKNKTNNTTDHFSDLKNDEFPYSAQNDAADEDAAAWQLSKITLPTGGEITVEYESDDYAYVQDRRAMKMQRIDGLIDGSGNPVNGLEAAEGFRIVLPLLPAEAKNPDDVLRKEWFVRNYLSGQPYLYAKLNVNVSDRVTSGDQQYYDYVPCYGEVARVDYSASGSTAFVYFKKEEIGKVKANPFSFAAWQKMRLEYPMYAYPGYKNRIDDDRPVSAAVSALASALGNFSELRMNFNKRAGQKDFANKVNLDRSYARLACYQSDKHGGGNRVKRIRLSDKWNEMTEGAGGATASYGQQYDYTITEEGHTYSSGVAAYEPSIGADENPMRMPVPYSQEFKWALSNVFYLEEPMGESLFPAPEVIYRRVTVNSLDAEGNPSAKMGYSVSEFYTAKEFPVGVQQTAPEKVETETKRWFPFFGGDYAHELYMSQGYVIRLNDMHGKPFKETVLNQTGDVISSMEYLYNSVEEGDHLALTGGAATPLDEDMASYNNLGRETDIFIDVREQETANSNKLYNAGVDVIPTFLAAPTPIPHVPLSKNNDYRLFRSASLLKTIEDYAILTGSIKTINGSTIKSENLLFDGYSGEVVISTTQNEFEDPVYTFTVPAYFSHESMGGAYKTLGLNFPQLTSDFYTGEIQGGLGSLLQPGDELVELNGNKRRMWVIESAEEGSIVKKKRLIDAGGRIFYFNGPAKVIRSGYRNHLTAKGASFVTLTNPMLGDGDMLRQFFQPEYANNYMFLNASAILYHEAWGKPSDCNLKSCPPGYTLSSDGKNCVLAAFPGGNLHPLKPAPSNTANGYGTGGTDIYLRGESQPYHRQDGYWSGGPPARLNFAGRWAENVPTGQWWGMEFCVDVPAVFNYPGHIYIGAGVDNNADIYIDGELFISWLDHQPWTYERWNVMSKDLEPGKHTVRIEAQDLDANSSAAFGLEMYVITDPQTLLGGDINAMESVRFFSTRYLADDDNVNVFTLSGPSSQDGVVLDAKWSCPNGGKLNLCDGTPNCGVKQPGDCPDGYTKSPDGAACIPIEGGDDNTDGILNIMPAPDESSFNSMGAILYDEQSPQGQVLISDYWGGPGTDCTPPQEPGYPPPPQQLCGRLNAAGVRMRDALKPNETYAGLLACFTIPQGTGGDHFIGYSAKTAMKIYIDDVLFDAPMPNQHQQWYIRKKSLSEGEHRLRIEAKASPGVQPVWGFDIYRATRAEVVGASAANRPTLAYSTNMLKDLEGNSFTMSASGAIRRARYKCGPELKDPCTGLCLPKTNGMVLNPYVTGYLGNWAVWKELVYLDVRDQNNVFDPARKDLNIRQSGGYHMVTPFYDKGSTDGYVYSVRDRTGLTPGWVVARTATMQDINSQELESKDALDRFSSAVFGFRNTLPVAVAANAMHREIYYDGFEDYRYFGNCLAKPACTVDGFDIRKTLGEQALTRLISTESHSGNYCLDLSQDITLSTWRFDKSHEHKPDIYLDNNINGEFFRKIAPWLGLWGFAPIGGKSYVFSAWVKDDFPTNAPTVKLEVDAQDVPLTHKATVERWKLVEGTFVMEGGADEMIPVTLTIKGGANIRIDDIRIFPSEANIKTYSYDDRTLRLMGELDENNYTTFYEYDVWGKLLRVKKETERGIITIKESRSALKKKNL
ncbi:hypothetical protein ACFOTA_17755 [Chitinophaga sp. GCM10012297]|uniref:PA14 domain-containing protein n=1 Tax=Chitinophaga chungangae TaxID=2821488 RepID=A0ABS3YHF0_9BACT|nr:hypothetical protein [Chitinophaga chungangae]MBO9154069.1 hypothetical protein [Chitinophaga chungangae]